MDLNFYGKWFSQVYLNNNGNLTISGPMSTYSPDTPFATINNTIIAPFFADVDTRDGYGSVVYGPAIVDGHTAWVANWDDVADYTVTATEDGDQPGIRDSFGVTLIDRLGYSAGDFDIQFSYSGLQWDTGDAFPGKDGLGIVPARLSCVRWLFQRHR